MKKHLTIILALGTLVAASGAATAQPATPAAQTGALALDPASDPALLLDPNAPAADQTGAPKLSFKIKGVNVEDEDGEGREDGEGHDGGHDGGDGDNG